MPDPFFGVVVGVPSTRSSSAAMSLLILVQTLVRDFVLRSFMLMAAQLMGRPCFSW